MSFCAFTDVAISIITAKKLYIRLIVKVFVVDVYIVLICKYTSKFWNIKIDGVSNNQPLKMVNILSLHCKCF